MNDAGETRGRGRPRGVKVNLAGAHQRGYYIVIITI